MAGTRLLCLKTARCATILNVTRIVSTTCHLRTYRKLGGHGKKDIMDGPFGNSLEERLKLVEKAEETENMFNQEPQAYIQKEFRELERARRRTKFKIIEKKYFKRSKELNLLTWDAKAQMRYLHQEFPNEWTIDRLAESFPISREGVISVLKSKWKPKSMTEVMKHDKAVRKRWLAISSGEKDALGGGGPFEDRFEKILKSGILGNAVGIASLPSPDYQRLFPRPIDQTTLVTSVIPLRPDGPINNPNRKKIFDVFARKLMPNDNAGTKKLTSGNEVDGELLPYRKQNINILQGVIEGLPKTLKTGNINQNRSTSNGHEKELHNDTPTRANSRKGSLSMVDDYEIKGVQTFNEKAFIAQAEATLDGEEEIPSLEDLEGASVEDRLSGKKLSGTNNNYQSGTMQGVYAMRNVDNSQGDIITRFMDPYSGPPPTKSLGRRRNGKPRVESKNQSQLHDAQDLEVLQMEGTGKTKARGGKELLSTDYETEGDVILRNSGRITKYASDLKKEQLFHQLRYDIPRRHRFKEGEVEEAYLFSEQTGYQHPFGKQDRDAQIDVPKGSEKNHRQRYQRGNSIYDENGELLFRIPE